MDLYLHNSLSGKKEKFEPIDPDHIKVYVCGPTVYNYVHIGNGRSAVAFDVLFRLLSHLYPKVTYLRNITDIDDRINAAALESGEPIAELSDRYTEAYTDDAAALGNLDPDLEPHATHHIPEIIAIIQTLIDRGHAYEAEGHVLFHVPSDPDYGTLSKRSLDDMIAGARVEVAPYKKHPADFVMWKPSTDDLPGWDSPWGYGRPGWHIECSAMIRKHLGETIDIHGGGSDLMFPHHENEIAQSRCSSDAKEYVHYWLHNGMLMIDEEKMSKSLGNFVTIRELRDRYDGEVLRYALISGQYRSSLSWSEDLIAQAQASLDRLYQSLLDTVGDEGLTSNDYAANRKEAPESVVKALCDDLNTPEALSAMHAIAGALNRSNDLKEAKALRRQLLAGGGLLGLLGRQAEEYFHATGPGTLDEAQIEAMITEREKARSNQDWATADRIRDELTAAGIELEDSRDGTRWRRKR
jgi:cysteinyl-tRNA synthetase